jgi:hypothetical protein
MDVLPNRYRRLQNGGRRLRPVDPIVATITLALFELGGAAHEATIADHIARQVGRSQLTPGEREELAVALAQQDIAPAPYFERCFGPDSRRWRLTERGERLFAAKPQAARPPRLSLGQPA